MPPKGSPMPPKRIPTANVLVAASHYEADHLKEEFPKYNFYVLVTPDVGLDGDFVIGRYSWTPGALSLSARDKLELRGKLASRMSPDSIEEPFFAAL